MYKKILCLNFTGDELEKSVWKRIDSLCEEKILIRQEDPVFKKHLMDADCLLVRLGASIDKKMIDDAPQLKYIGMFGTGYGRIDTEYASEKGITVTNIAGYSTEGVAELVFGAIIEHIRELERAKSQARKGDYSESTFKGYEIRNKKFGVIGLGRIGQRVAEIALKGFGAQVFYWSKNRKKDLENLGVRYQTIETLLKECDFVSIHFAYVPQTKGILNSKRIKMIKSKAVVVNLAPMELINIKALRERLKKEDITFILDHSDELAPYDAKSLSKYKNCIMYPPIGYVTKEATQAKLSLFVDNIENFLKGKPTNKVN